jgi:hypothetical protein
MSARARLLYRALSIGASLCALASCVSDGDTIVANDKTQGALGGQCFSTGTCNPGLICVAQVCNSADSAEGGVAPDAGATDAAGSDAGAGADAGASDGATSDSGPSIVTTGFAVVGVEEPVASGGTYASLGTPEAVTVHLAASTDLAVFYSSTVHPTDAGCALTTASNVVTLDGTKLPDSTSSVVLPGGPSIYAGLPSMYVIGGVKAGTHTIAMQHASDTCAVGFLKRALSVQPANGVWLDVGAAESTMSITSTSLTTAESVSVTPPASGSIAVLYFAHASVVQNTNVPIGSSALLDGNVVSGGAVLTYPASLTNNGQAQSIMAVTSAAAGAHALTIHHSVGDTASTATWSNRTLLVRGVSSSSLHASVASADSTTSTTYVDLGAGAPESVTVSPTAPTTMLVAYGAGMLTTGPSSCAGFSEIYLDASPVDGSEAEQTFTANGTQMSTAMFFPLAVGAGTHTISIRHKAPSCGAEWTTRTLMVEPL